MGLNRPRDIATSATRFGPRVVVLLPKRLAERVAAATSPEFDIVAITPAQFERVYSKAQVSCVLLDPTLVSEAAARRMVAEVGAAHLVLYLAPTPAGVRHAPNLVRAGMRHLLIADVDDSAEAIRSILATTHRGSLAETFAARVSAMTAAVPLSLSSTMADVVLLPAAYRGSQDVCTMAQMPRRTCDRWISRSPMRSLHRLLQASRAVAGATLLRLERLQLDSVARSVGARSGRTLAKDIHTILGASPRAAARLSNRVLLRRAEASLLRGARERG